MNFNEKLTNPQYKRTGKMTTLQVNLGKMCNMHCAHCHVEAGLNREEEMSREVLEACLRAYDENGFESIDITGGAPEMNKNFQWFLQEACKRSPQVIVRTNLTILQEADYHHFIKEYADNGVEVVASLPCYTKENTDTQRGKGAFEASIKSIKELNALGYGRDPQLVLDFVYNPLGAFLPGAQDGLENDYKERLKTEHDIVFNKLFTITNNPVGRFKSFLESKDEYDDYMNLLKDSYNEATEEHMMCRFQVSVGYDGTLYDCDFNQALMLPLKDKLTIFDIAEEKIGEREIVFANHCYACTAGHGSSCGGATE